MELIGTNMGLNTLIYDLSSHMSQVSKEITGTIDAMFKK
jgi:hypothetical protein